jgi:tetrapyrrole methylase family protein/MazG family protein
MREFQDFIEVVRKGADLDGWVARKGLEGYTHEIKKEVDEAIQAFDDNDFEHMKEEMGDVLHDWAHAVILAEREGRFTMEDVLKEITLKMERRRPFLKEGRKVGAEEASRIWKEAKEKERS